MATGRGTGCACASLAIGNAGDAGRLVGESEDC